MRTVDARLCVQSVGIPQAGDVAVSDDRDGDARLHQTDCILVDGGGSLVDGAAMHGDPRRARRLRLLTQVYCPPNIQAPHHRYLDTRKYWQVNTIYVSRKDT